jgi:protein gp37
MREARRHDHEGGAYQGLTRIRRKDGAVDWSGDVVTTPDKVLTKPLHWRKPRRIFVNSMSDLFHESLSDEDIDRVFGVMWACLYMGRDAVPGHVFQVLTKRSARMREYMSADRRRWWASAAVRFGGGLDPDGLWDQTMRWYGPHPRIWLGVSVEDQARAEARVPDLLRTPAAVRFVSAEPLLEALDLRRWLHRGGECECEPAESSRCDELRSRQSGGWIRCNLGTRRIDWVIGGGESGSKARPMCLSWARNIVHDCHEAGVACFFKQLGARSYETTDDENAHETWPVGRWLELKHRKGGNLEEWPADLRVREWPDGSAE